ncbi:hypothetical protein BC629DRAFT_1592864 [Irpex lacteus]|nr:hypothetical protein BC629DRAFT_1592864 [Irpex lacteus]
MASQPRKEITSWLTKQQITAHYHIRLGFWRTNTPLVLSRPLPQGCPPTTTFPAQSPFDTLDTLDTLDPLADPPAPLGVALSHSASRIHLKPKDPLVPSSLMPTLVQTPSIRRGYPHLLSSNDKTPTSNHVAVQAADFMLSRLLPKSPTLPLPWIRHATLSNARPYSTHMSGHPQLPRLLPSSSLF